MRILVIEDDSVIGPAVRQGFCEATHECELVANGSDGLIRARSENWDVVVLDLMLPGKPGLEVLAELRQSGVSTPVILLTAKDALDDRVVGLNAGADDYLVKPFAFAELMARAQAVCRRAAIKVPSIKVVGDLTLDPTSRRVSRAGRPIDLSPTQFSILELLMRNAGQVVTRKMLCEHVWGFHWDGTTNVIEVHVNHLRGKLDAGRDDSCIQTVRGRGYVLRTE